MMLSTSNLWAQGYHILQLSIEDTALTLLHMIQWKPHLMSLNVLLFSYSKSTRYCKCGEISLMFQYSTYWCLLGFDIMQDCGWTLDISEEHATFVSNIYHGGSRIPSNVAKLIQIAQHHTSHDSNLQTSLHFYSIFDSYVLGDCKVSPKQRYTATGLALSQSPYTTK